MKKLPSSRNDQFNGTKAAQQLNRKKLFAIVFSTLLMLVVVSEGIRLVLTSW
jgi:hypothetical protein